MTHDSNANLLLPWYSSGSLTPDERTAVEHELTVCAECRDELADQQQLHRSFENMTIDEPQSDVMARVFARIDEAAAATQHRAVRRLLDRFERLRSWKVAVPVAAALILLGFVVTRGPGPKPLQGVFALYGGPTSATVSGDLASAPVAAPELRQNAAAKTLQRAASPQLARTGSIGLVVPNVDQALAAVALIADRNGGSVRNLTDAGSNGSDRLGASVEIAVPSAAFGRAMDGVATLGEVTSRSIRAEDVSDQLVDGRARLVNLRHEEADLVRIMDRSGRVADILDVEQQLASVREQIERLDAEQRATSSRVAFSTIDVSLNSTREAFPDRGFPAELRHIWSRAFRASGATLVGLIGLGIWALAYLPYVLVAAALGYWVYRRVRR